MAELILDVSLLALIAVTAVVVIEARGLFAAVMLAGIYSLLMAAFWQTMDAMDVAFTEAAVGAGISTILLLATISHVGREEKRPTRAVHWPALIVVVLTGGALIYGTLDMPRFGDPAAPIHTYRVPRLLAQEVGKVADAPVQVPGEFHDDLDMTLGEDRPEKAPAAHAQEHADDDHHHAHPVDDFGGHVPNTVTSLLAAYRGYDTMYETAVIFIAGMGMVLLLRRTGGTRRIRASERTRPADAGEEGRP